MREQLHVQKPPFGRSCPLLYTAEVLGALLGHFVGLRPVLAMIAFGGTRQNAPLPLPLGGRALLPPLLLLLLRCSRHFQFRITAETNPDNQVASYQTRACPREVSPSVLGLFGHFLHSAGFSTLSVGSTVELSAGGLRVSRGQELPETVVQSKQ